jgi:3-oxoadipate enol-lactonase
VIQTEDGVELALTDRGDGDLPVVLLHAFPLDARMWEPQIDALADNHRLLALDLRGFGGSSAPDDVALYSMETYARDVIAVLDALTIERAVIAGLSMGGYIAFELWRRIPDRIAALVLADTRSAPDTDEARDKRTAQQDAVRREGIGNLVEVLIDGLLGSQTKANKPDVVEKMRALMQNPAPGYIGALEALKQRPDSSADLAGIDVPVLILVGEDDTVTPPEMSRAMHEAIPDSRLAVVAQAGHISNLETPGEFSGALEDFLRSL